MYTHVFCSSLLLRLVKQPLTKLYHVFVGFVISTQELGDYAHSGSRVSQQNRKMPITHGEAVSSCYQVLSHNYQFLVSGTSGGEERQWFTILPWKELHLA
ncbi:hypothetical protein RUM44_008584 [Polyplax serrata]|uniref:Secreted protein n=1 Tax=Polyplax serrata TaxID=468196 RepID=A0ABR1BCN5_POLSC